MSSKPPTPFGAGSGSKVDSKPSAVPSGSVGYPPMSSKPPTPFGAGSGSKVDSKPSAVPSGSVGYPSMSSKAPTLLGERLPTETDITVQTESKPPTSSDSAYRSISSRSVAPSRAKGVVAVIGEVEAMKSMSVYESNTWDVITSFDITLQELRTWHGLLEEDWKEEFGMCVESALNASKLLRNDFCSLEASLQVGERDVHEAKGTIAELKWQTVETCSLVLEASSPNYLRLLETQELEKPAAELRDSISLSAAKLADNIVTIQQILALYATLKEGGGVAQPENPPRALANLSQSSGQPTYAGRILFGGFSQKRLGFGYGAKPRRGSSDKVNLEKGPQLVRVGNLHKAASSTKDYFYSGNRRPSQPPTTSPAAMALLRIVSSTYQRSKEIEATWQGLKNTSSFFEEGLLSKRSSRVAIHKGRVGKVKAVQEGGHDGWSAATNSKNGNRQVDYAQLTRHWKHKLLCLLMDEAGMCKADHVTEISSHACSSYSLPLLGSQRAAATSVSDILKGKQRVSLLLPSGTLSGLPEMPDLPMPITPPKMAATRISEKGLVVWPAAAADGASSKPGKPSREQRPSLTFEAPSSKSSATISAGPLTSTALPVVVAHPTNVVASHEGQVTAATASGTSVNEGLLKLKGTTCSTAPQKMPPSNVFPIPEESTRVVTQVPTFQGHGSNHPAISSVKKTEKVSEMIFKEQQMARRSEATVSTPEEGLSSSTAVSSKPPVSKDLFQGSSSSSETAQVPFTSSATKAAAAASSKSAYDPSNLEAKLPSSAPSELKGGGRLGASSSTSPFDISSKSDDAKKGVGLGETCSTLKPSSSAAGSFHGGGTPTKSLFGNISVPVTPSSVSDLKNHPTATASDASEHLTTSSAISTPPLRATESSSNQVAVSDIRDEIIKIYQKYNASKVGNVDQLLTKYKGNETVLLARLKEKYGKVDDLSASNASGAAAAPQTQAVATTPATTSSVFGSALGSLGTSAGIQPSPSPFGIPKSGGDPSPVEGSIFGASASKVANIDPFGGATRAHQQQQAVSVFYPSPGAATNAVVAPFGTMATVSTPTTSSFSSSSMAAAAATPSSNSLEILRQWMISVYQKHDPPRVSKVDSFLERYHGKEADMVARLVKKYNEHPPQQLQAELQLQKPQQQTPQQGSFGGNTFGMGSGGPIFGTQQQQQRGFGVIPSSAFGSTHEVQRMTGSGVNAGFGGSALGTSNGIFGLQSQKSQPGFGGSFGFKGQGGGFGTLAQQQPQSSTFGTPSAFSDASKPPNAFSGASFMQMRG